MTFRSYHLNPNIIKKVNCILFLDIYSFYIIMSHDLNI